MTFAHLRLPLLAALACAALAAACTTVPTATPDASAAPKGGAAGPPPTAPNPGTRVALVNPGFESTVVAPRGDPEGWQTVQHAGVRSYLFSLDTDNPHSGARSLRLENVGQEPFGAVAQNVDARTYGGKTVRLSAWLRTRDARDDGAGLTLRALRGGNIAAYNFMFDAPVKGTTGWTRYTITLPVPVGTTRLELGAMLRGNGSLWFDDVELELVP